MMPPAPRTESGQAKAAGGASVSGGFLDGDDEAIAKFKRLISCE
jgi:hypothetical protein